LISACIIGLFLAAVLAGCSRQSDPGAEDTIAQADESETSAPPAPVTPTLKSELKKLCENQNQNPASLPAPFSAIRSEVRHAVAQLYSQRQYQPWWFDGETLQLSDASSAVDAFSMAKFHALDPANYFPAALQHRLAKWKQVAEEDRLRESALTDLALTLCIAALAYDLQMGSVPHQAVVSTWDGVNKTFDAEPLLSRIRGGESAKDILESYAPQHAEYRQLKQALATYRKTAEAGGWQAIDAALLNGLKDRELETGSHALVPLLRERLTKEGYDVSPPENPDAQNVYNDSLKNAMQQFQANRGLEPDGIVGPLTLKSINIPVEDLIEKITWSMDRWRWLPENLGDRHILVNVPEFALRAYKDGEAPLQMRVIVGSSDKGTHTPLFADEMEYVIFRPYWNVPRSIIEGEIVPEIKKDRGYVKQFNYEIVDRFSPEAEVFKPSRRNIERLENGELQIRQTAGPYNALGLVKFIFPNAHAVYLHDTNQRSLFVHSQRDLSHGCIRVHDPEALARYALPNDQWSEEKIHQAMYAGERQMVRVGSNIPVYIFYLTAFAEADKGPIGFFTDVYHYDDKMAAYKRKPSEIALR
jgi:murein L,D-transpeptidase YcbB/YkuD